jgi:short-subunit dehydrogenase
MSKIWIIGASEGIGAALAEILANDGHRIAVSARNEDALVALKKKLISDSLAIKIDVTSLESIETAWNEIKTKWERPDIVIYNAGAYEPMEATKFNLQQAEKMVDVNFSGAMRVLSFVLPEFIAANSGHIALVGSVAGYRGLPSAIGYGASKAAIIHLAENLKLDLKDTNIKVQIINPGFVKTRLTDKNNFNMPSMISPEKAAKYIADGLFNKCFEIHFPKRFSYILKFLAALPYRAYFYILSKIKI